jgi:16S rRNA (adenine1518-N6/adenine1519-N6)-dimethyltransferase
LQEHLHEALSDCPNLDLRFEDALKFPYDTLPDGTVVVANLPYYLSSPLLFRLFAARDRVSRMILMLQTEVARRLAAGPGSRDYGILSVLASYYAEVTIAFQVSSGCFRPRPEVGSAVVNLVIRKHPPVMVLDEPTLVRTVRAAFAHRRKTLSNSLRDEGIPLDAINRALGQAGLVSSRRAETLTLAEFAALANALAGARQK